MNTIRGMSAGWNAFWFEPRQLAVLSLPRLAICLVSALWWASFFRSVGGWFGPTGWLSAPVAARMIEFEQSARWQNWSVLWWTDSIAIVHMWLASGIVLSLLAAAGWGGRAILIGLLFWIINWAHRLVWLQGPAEPLLAAAVAYLIVQPGVPLWRHRAPQARQTRWTAGLAVRLLQTHLWILLAAGLLSQLASLIWWRGEAVWWLSASGRSLGIDPSLLNGRASLVNGLTHALIVIQMLALWWLTVPAARAAGLLCALVAFAAYALVADLVLYGLLLAAMLAAFPRSAENPITSHDGT